MHYIKKITFIMAFISILLSCAVNASYEIDFTENNSFETVILYKNGNTDTLSGIINTDSIEKSAVADEILSYEIYKDGVRFLSVNLVDIKNNNNASLYDETAPLNGYYSTTFTLSEKDNTEVFLTGLTHENIKIVQQALISAKIENSEFSIEDIDFIDTDKLSQIENGDDLLCWAATTANILHYTGWAKKASSSFVTTDDIFDDFVNNFTDDAGEPFRGIEWFLNGSYLPQTRDSWGHVKNFGNSGGYLKKYSSSVVSSYHYSKTIADYFLKNHTLLKEGYGLSIELAWLTMYGDRTGGHAITCWGYIVDKDHPSYRKDYLKALLVSDSDDEYSPEINDRRGFPNKLVALNTAPFNEFGYDSWQFEGYGYLPILESCTFLKPYSDSLPYETDSTAKLDKINYPDLTPMDVTILVDGNFQSSNYKKYYSGSALTFQLGLKNEGNVDYVGNVYPHLTVKNNLTNKIIYNNAYNSNATVAKYSYGHFNKYHNPGMLSNGKYTVISGLNEKKSVSEAYYYNNTMSKTFEIISKPSEVSGGKLTASIGAFTNGSAKVTFSYGTLNKVSITDKAVGRIYKSVYTDSQWSAYEEITAFSDTNSVFHSECYIPDMGTKIKFKFVYAPDSDTIPLEFISPEYDLSYTKLKATVSENNTYYPSSVNSKDKRLKDGEKFEFCIENISSANLGTAKYDLTVFAKKDDETTTLYSLKNQTVAYGGSSGNIAFTSWTENLMGSYEIYAEISGDFGRDTVLLGYLNVNEAPSFIVNTEDTGNIYDGKTSLSEAISYYESYASESDVITIEKGINPTLQYPIFPNKNVKISGCGNTITIPANLHFSISSGKTLTLSNVTLKLKDGGSGGGINVNQGTVILDNVTFDNCKKQSGVAINATGATVTMKNCAVINCTSTTGSIIALNQYSTLNAIGCIFNGNTSNANMIEVQYSNASFYYCTFTNNKAGDGRAVINNGYYMPVCTIGCIIANPLSDYDINGRVHVYGSLYGSCGTSAVIDEYSEEADCRDLFLCDKDGNVVLSNENGVLKYKMSDKINGGIKLRNNGNTVTYSEDDKVFASTSATAFFKDEDYLTDRYGILRSFEYGADATVSDKAEFVAVTDDEYIVFSPDEKNVTLYEKGENSSNKIITLIKKDISVSPGTNYVSIEPREKGLNYKYLLWDSEKDLIPVTCAGEND